MIQTVLRRAFNHALPSSTGGVIYRFSTTVKQNENASSTKTSGIKSSYWIDSVTTKSSTSPLKADTTVDTCVIGGGIAGLTTAYFLAKQGQKVALLEDGDVSSGETGRTTGYLTNVIDDGLTNIISYYGKDGARLHVDSHKSAIDMVERISRDESIDSQFKRVPSYWISRKPKSKQSGDVDKEIKAEYDAMIDSSMDATIVDKPPYAVDDGKCIKIARQGQFHSVNYCHGLVKGIQKAGGSVYTKSKVQDYKDGKKPWAKTIDGYTVTCDSLVMATNVPLQLITTIGKLEAYRTYIVGGKVPKGKYEWCVFQDDSMVHDHPYKYGRFTYFDDTHDLLLVGGEDHLVGFDTNYEERYSALEKWTAERYPDIDFNYRWSGQVQEPADLIASIGLNPGAKNTYIITGDSGMGLTHGTLGGKLISDIILGIPNPWKDLYDPNRVKVKAAPEVLKHLAEVNLQYKDYFKSGDVESVSEITPGKGAIISKGIHNYAVYKDENGEVHARTAVCPHMKGLVRWNDEEKSWDCPIHGSRFDRFGKTLIGPAKTDLAEAKLEDVKK